MQTVSAQVMTLSNSIVPEQFRWTVAWWLVVYVGLLFVWAFTAARMTMDARRTFGRSKIVRWGSLAIGLVLFVGIPATIPRLLFPGALLLCLVPFVHSILRVYNHGGVGLAKAIREGLKHAFVLGFSMTVRSVTFAAHLVWTVIMALVRFDWATLQNIPELVHRASDRVQRAVSPNSSRDVVILQESGLPLESEGDFRLKGLSNSTLPKISYFLKQAVLLRAADVIMPMQSQGPVEVRFRVDGVLLKGPIISREEGALIARAIKLIAGMSVSGDTPVQEGAFPIMYGNRRSDVFVETAPREGGETLSLRITAEERIAIEAGFGGLGIDDAAVALVRKLIGLQRGLLLVVGRPDSGKSTSLYAAMTELRQLGRSVVSVEKSMRHRMDHITQMRAGSVGTLSFSKAIEAALGHGPDVLVVRDIFDRQTAEVCIREANSGRLVVAGFNADHAVDGLQRLISLGVDAGMLRLALAGVLSQRLVRVLCDSCKTAYPPTPELAAKLRLPVTDALRFHRSVGCPNCRGSGFVGRTGIFELLPISDKTRVLLGNNGAMQNIAEALRGATARSLRQSAIAKVCQGITSVEEIARVLK